MAMMYKSPASASIPANRPMPRGRQPCLYSTPPASSSASAHSAAPPNCPPSRASTRPTLAAQSCSVERSKKLLNACCPRGPPKIWAFMVGNARYASPSPPNSAIT